MVSRSLGDIDLAKREITLSLVVPVYNEEEAVALFVESVSRVFEGHHNIKVEMVFINDGSADQTLEKLITLQSADKRIRILDFSRNFGKEAALTAGLYAASGQVVVPIDVDLQDPPELIPELIAKWREGYEVVLARRSSRSTDSWPKRNSARLFYLLHNKIAKPRIPENVGDFRLMDRKVVDALKQLPETHRFMKGLFAWVGFRTTEVSYIRQPRAAGETKFNAWKLWNFALEGMTSFSTSSLRIWTYFGFTVSFLSFMFAVYIVARVAIQGIDVPGYASLIVAIAFFGGLQLVGIGIIGEYLGRTYMESKRRPLFVVRRIYDGSDQGARVCPPLAD